MSPLAPLDWIIVVTFFVVTLVAGLAMTRRAGRNIEAYFLGGRSLPWYLLGVAGMTSWFDLTGTMFITSFLYLLGPRGLFISFGGGAVLVLAFMAAFTGKWHRRSGCMTQAEWVKFRFGEEHSARWMRLIFAIKWIIVTVASLAYLIRGTTLFVGQFVPFSPLVVTVVIVGISGLYTILAGFYGLVLTDLIQGVIILGASIVMAWMAHSSVAGTAELAAMAKTVTGNPHWTESLPRWHTPMPPGYEVYSSLILFAGFYLLRSILVGLGTGGESRYFAARDDRECGLQSMMQGFTIVFRWPMMIGFAILGLVLVQRQFPDHAMVSRAAAAIHEFHPETNVAHWHDLTARLVAAPAAVDPRLSIALTDALGTDWPDRLALVGHNGSVNPEQILPAVIARLLPAGLRAFVLVAMLAAMMSTLTSWLNQAGAVVVKDIYQNVFRPRASDREMIFCSYGVSVILVVSAFWMGTSAKSINDLWGWVMIGLTSGWIAPLALRLYWWRCNAWGVIYGIALGGAAAVIQRLVFPTTVEWMQFVVISAFSFAGTIVGSLLTTPTSRPVLEDFYRVTRPFGFWGTLRDTLPPGERAGVAHEHRHDLYCIPFFLVAQVTAFLLPMQWVIHDYHAMVWTGLLFLLGAAGVYHFLWRRLRKQAA